MLMPNLAEYLNKYPTLRDFLPRVDEYLQLRLTKLQNRNENDIFVDKTVTAHDIFREIKGCSTSFAIAILKLACDDGILEFRYVVLCHESSHVLGVYKTLDAIPEEIVCNLHNSSRTSQADKDEWIVLTFKFTDEALANRVQV